MLVNKDFSCEDVKLLTFEEFKKMCIFFFDCYFEKGKYDCFTYKNYYCGEGCISFTIYEKGECFNQITITQNDYYQEKCFDLYEGFGKDEKHISDFVSLTNVFNYIIKLRNL